MSRLANTRSRPTWAAFATDPVHILAKSATARERQRRSRASSRILNTLGGWTFAATALLCVLPSAAAQEFSSTDAASLRSAQAALDAEQYQRAVESLNRLQPRYPKAPEIPQLLMHAYFGLQRFDEARQSALEAIRLGRFSADVLARLAQINQETDDAVALLNTVRLLTVLEPDNSTWRRIYADLLAAQGLLAESAAVFQTLLNERPDSAELNLQLANVQMEIGNRAEAVAGFETAWHLGASNPQLPLTIAGLWQQLDDPQQALSWFERHAAESDAVDANVRLQMAQLERAVDDLQSATKSAEELTTSDDESVKSQAHLLLGQIAMDQDRADEAIVHWQRAVEHGAASRPLIAAIGAHYYNKGDFEKAAQHLRRAAAGPEPDEQHLRFLTISLVRTEDFADARKALQRYVEHHGFTDQTKELIRLWVSSAN